MLQQVLADRVVLGQLGKLPVPDAIHSGVADMTNRDPLLATQHGRYGVILSEAIVSFSPHQGVTFRFPAGNLGVTMTAHQQKMRKNG